MILKPFTVTSGGKTYTYVDRLAIDSEVLKRDISIAIEAAMDLTQFEAQCEQMGLNADGSIPSMRLGVFESGILVGVWLLGCIQYVSGPWVDTVDWVKTSGDPAKFTSRFMPGFPALAPAVEDAIAADTAIHLLGTGAPHRSYEDTNTGFDSLHYAIYKRRSDSISLRAIRLHNAGVAHPGLKLTERTDPTDANRTLVKLELP